MRLAIDASNISKGGGVTHLVNLIENFCPIDFGFNEVVIYCPGSVSLKLPKRDWLKVHSSASLDKGFIWRSTYRLFKLSRILRANDFDLIFSPGGTVLTKADRTVTMFRNMLPFDSRERRRLGIGLFRLKMEILRLIQLSSFRRAAGVIFLNDYAEKVIEGYIKDIKERSAVVPHGVNNAWSSEGKKLPQALVSRGDRKRIVYVSSIDLYKHQWLAVEAIALLAKKGIECELHIVGDGNGAALKKLLISINKFDPDRVRTILHGALVQSEVVQLVQSADVLLFASTCENMPNILLEYMATGVPIVYSASRPMVDIAGDCATSFPPESVEGLSDSLEYALSGDSAISEMAMRGKTIASNYSWNLCARQTGLFLERLARS